MSAPLSRRPALRPLALALLGLLSSAHADEAAELGAITVRENKTAAEKVLAPSSSEGADRRQIAETVNAVDSADAFKYLPDVLVRKRFIGDTDAPIASRTTGINASARSLVYADGTLLTPLINNNNQNGSPRWFMVAPEEIERIDVLYGPFSAAYPGNSYGLVASIATRLPDKLEGSVKLTGSVQDFKQYGSQDSYAAQQLAATLGNRVGDFAFWFSLNHLDSRSQPVSYATLAQSTTAGGTTPLQGGYAERNRTNDAIRVLGAGSLTHTVQDSAKLKLAYDFSPAIQAAYTFGLWQNQADIRADSYLTDASGRQYWGGSSGTVQINGYRYNASAIAALFAPASRDMEHQMHALSLRDKSSSGLSWDLGLSHYEYVRHQERTALTGAQGSGAGAVTYPTYAATVGGSGAGRIVDMHGTGWTTADASATWRPDGARSEHIVSLGAHVDQYTLVSPTYSTDNWASGGNGTLFSDARGKSQTSALWLQDVWRFAPALKATLGGRYEWWRAYDGVNATANTARAGWPVSTVQQPGQERSAFSPKLALSWDATDDWQLSGALGRAVRFPTVGELYQTILVGTNYQSSNPDLKPEEVTTGELAIEHQHDKGRVRLSLFQETVRDALISQTAIYPATGTTTSFMQNVDKTRQRGIELVARHDDVLIRGLELSGSLTYVDARILANNGYVPATAGATSVGKHTPYVPDWRATLVASYRPDERWTYTVAGRYSGRMYATVDNTDVNGHTYQGFERFFVADARIRYQVARQWSAAFGVDNLNNRKYYLFHPFPQRTAFAELKFDY
jgi:iron complex outermembrane receptor protein